VDDDKNEDKNDDKPNQGSIAGGEEEPQEDGDEPTFHESDNDDTAAPALDNNKNESMGNRHASETPAWSKAKPRSKCRFDQKEMVSGRILGQ
jgi:hypothetical protein